MKHLQNNWRPFLVLSLFLGLAIIFRTFLITDIFEPIAMLFWAAWRIISSVHQNTYWIILILICSIPVIRLIPSRRNTSGSAYRDEYRPVNRVEEWLTLIKNAPPGADEIDYLRNRLDRLLISIQQLERFPSIELHETIAPEAVALPLAVRRFLFPVKKKNKTFPGDYWSYILFWIPKWFRKRAGKIFRIDDPAIEETLTWMESLMEISNDQ